MQCRLCKDESDEESEKHLLKCVVILQNIDKHLDLSSAGYDDIFSENIEAQISITKIFAAIFKVRNDLLGNY